MNEVIDPTLVDFAALSRWMDGQGLGEGPLTGANRLSGGTQNVLVRFTRSGRDYILRRPPPTMRASSNTAMLREARLLVALAGSDVPHPGLIAACDDPGVLGGAVFYLMEPVDGFSAPSGLPPLHAASPVVRRRMGFALVEGLAALHKIDYLAVDLDGFGSPEGYLARQVDRWLAQLDGYARFDRWPGAGGLPGLREVADWLREHLPPGTEPGIVHGDYQLANVLYRRDGPELAAIVDWELASIGDPLVDLGWIVATWHGSERPDLPVLRVEPWEGFPGSDELIAHYAGSSDRDLTHIGWYVVLACFRLGILLEGTHARACNGAAPADTGRVLHEAAAGLFTRAANRIRGGREV